MLANVVVFGLYVLSGDYLRREDAKVYEAALLDFAKPYVPLRVEKLGPQALPFKIDRKIYVLNRSEAFLQSYPDSKSDDEKKPIPTDPSLKESFSNRNRTSELLTWFSPTSKWIRVINEKQRDALRRTPQRPTIYTVCLPGYSKNGRWAFLCFGFVGYMHPGRINVWLHKTKGKWSIARRESNYFL